MKLMRVDSSPKGDKSNSRMLADEFVALLRQRIPQLSIDYLDLALEPPPHVTAEFAKATYTPAEHRTQEMREVLAPSDTLCKRILNADTLMFSMPMYNWSMPSNFKAFIDAIVRQGLTYGQKPDGSSGGFLGNKRVLFITTRGADTNAGSYFEGMDALTPALRAAFGFLGVENPTFVDAQPTEFALPEQRERALASARTKLAGIVEAWLDG